MAEKSDFSPMMQEYLKTKEQYQDCILFYRLGDFYEMFFDDAIKASKELELTLTGKLCGQEERAPMCGIPYHAADVYIAKLIERGYKVAICEQLEDPKKAKGIVKRGVIRIVTPGTVIESNLLDEKENNYIMSIYKSGTYFGISACDISTGDFRATQIKEINNFPKLLDEISRYTPAEIVVNPFMFDSEDEIAQIKERFEIYVSRVKEEAFTNSNNEIKEEDLKTQNQINESEDSVNLNINKTSEIQKVSKIEERFSFVNEHDEKIENTNKYELAINSINGLLYYLTDTQKSSLDHINKIIFYSITKYMALDISARRNLEITEKLRDKSKKGTLLWVLDKTSTSMGGRLLRRWLNDPLIDVFEINERLRSSSRTKRKHNTKRRCNRFIKKSLRYGTPNSSYCVWKCNWKRFNFIKEFMQTTSKCKKSFNKL